MLVTGLICVAGCSGAHTDTSSKSAQPSVSLTTVGTAPYTEQITAVGRIGAPAGSETRLSFAVAGILQSVDVHIGQQVSAGQPLAQLDVSGLSLAASQARADAQAAVANAKQSSVDRTTTRIAVDEAALRRAQSLYAAGVSAYKDVEAARAQLAQDHAEALTAHAQISGANAQERSAQARAALAERDLSNGTLRSPVDGIVTAILKRPGEAVDTTTPVVAIGPGSTHEITLTVAAADAARVHAGDPVSLSVPGTDLRSSGEVSGVSPAVDPTTQAATVVVRGIPSGAPAGSAVQATIEVAHDRGIVIPESAVVQDPQSGQTLVFVQGRDKNGDTRFEQRSVRIARENGAQALIASGLRPGEQIASQGAFALLAPAGGGD
jgi:RND family efflux transporter MFP subunit